MAIVYALYAAAFLLQLRCCSLPRCSRENHAFCLSEAWVEHIVAVAPLDDALARQEAWTFQTPSKHSGLHMIAVFASFCIALPPNKLQNIFPDC